MFLHSHSRTGCLSPSLFLFAILHPKVFSTFFAFSWTRRFISGKVPWIFQPSSQNLIQALLPSMAKGGTEWLEVLCHLSDLNWSSMQPHINCVHSYSSVTQAKISNKICPKASAVSYTVLEILVSRSQSFCFRLSFMGGQMPSPRTPCLYCPFAIQILEHKLFVLDLVINF